MCSWVAQAKIWGMLTLCTVTDCPAFVETSDPPEQDSTVDRKERTELQQFENAKMYKYLR